MAISNLKKKLQLDNTCILKLHLECCNVTGGKIAKDIEDFSVNSYHILDFFIAVIKV